MLHSFIVLSIVLSDTHTSYVLRECSVYVHLVYLHTSAYHAGIGQSQRKGRAGPCGRGADLTRIIMSIVSIIGTISIMSIITS